MNDQTIHEIKYTTAKDLDTETIGFGYDGEMAKRVYDWTTNQFMRDGYILMGNIKNPNAVEVIQRGGPTVCWLELTSRPALDVENITAAIKMTAMLSQQRNWGCHYAVLMAEKALKEARYIAVETQPDGKVIPHYLTGDRQEAMQAFIQMVNPGNKKARRCSDALDKYAVFEGVGEATKVTTWEFRERDAQ